MLKHVFLSVLLMVFVGCMPVISGSIWDSQERGLPDIPFEASGEQDGNAVKVNTKSNDNGRYALAVPIGFSGIVQPLPAVVLGQIVPDSRSYADLQADQSGQDFMAELLMVTLSGKVCKGDGSGMAGVTVSSVGALQDGNEYNTDVVTDANGNYALVLPWGWTGTTTPSKEGYSFRAESCSAP